jgi:type II secretory pathway component PulF
MSIDASFFHSLAALHRAGIPWPQAVATAVGGGSELLDVQRALQQGTSLADALGPRLAPLDRAVLTAAEVAGSLEGALERIAVRHEEEARLQAGRRGALAYPVVMGHIAAVLAAVPAFIGPHPARGFLWMLGILIPLWTVLWLARPRHLGKSDAPMHPGSTPPKARWLKRSAVEEADARALLALADGYDSGLRLDDTLRLAGTAGAGGRVSFDLYRARPRVEDGKPLSSAWHAVPDGLAKALTIGESTGELGAVARREAATLGFGVAMRRKKVAALLPLGLMLLVGAVVAWRVVSFYSSMYSNLPKL